MRLGTSMNRHLRIAVLMVSAAVMAVLLTQCQMVEDRIAAPQLSLNAQNGTGSCISNCAREYAVANRDEAARHVAAIQECGGVESCLDYENIVHTRNVAKIAADRKNCFDACHHQGGGTGGR